MRRWLAFTPLVLLAVLVAAAAIMLTRSGERETFSAGLIGRQAPVYELASLDGAAPISAGARQGRAYVINLFASWCTPCRAEHPLLMALKNEGVEIVGVAYKDEPGAAAKMIAAPKLRRAIFLTEGKNCTRIN